MVLDVLQAPLQKWVVVSNEHEDGGSGGADSLGSKRTVGVQSTAVSALLCPALARLGFC